MHHTDPSLPLPQPDHTGSSFRHRSEEHTSELQSQSNLVCRLLLEKKKKAANLHRGLAEDVFVPAPFGGGVEDRKTPAPVDAPHIADGFTLPHPHELVLRPIPTPCS